MKGITSPFLFYFSLFGYRVWASLFVIVVVAVAADTFVVKAANEVKRFMRANRAGGGADVGRKRTQLA